MAIRVRFDKNGFYHPAFGRLGRGKNVGQIYVLPDAFGERETLTVPVMDNTSKPPRKIGEKEITRYKNLPSSAEVLDDETMQQLIEEAELQNEAPPKPVYPRVAEKEALERVTGRGKIAARQDAQERTTGTKRRSRRAAAVD